MTGLNNYNQVEQTPDTIERQAFAKELGELAEKWPDLAFEDRGNKKNFGGIKWRKKNTQQGDTPPPVVDVAFLRFQALRPVIEHVKFAAIPGVRFSMNQMVMKKQLVAWASTPTRLGDILRGKGVLP